METINGEWIMKGCCNTDPFCLHSLRELISLIHNIGFLPLFSNDISGFLWRSMCRQNPGGLVMRIQIPGNGESFCPAIHPSPTGNNSQWKNQMKKQFL